MLVKEGAFRSELSGNWLFTQSSLNFTLGVQSWLESVKKMRTKELNSKAYHFCKLGMKNQLILTQS